MQLPEPSCQSFHISKVDFRPGWGLVEREEGEPEDGELIALEKALSSKLGVEVGEEGRVLEEGVDPGGGLGLIKVADLAVAVNLGGE